MVFVGVKRGPPLVFGKSLDRKDNEKKSITKH